MKNKPERMSNADAKARDDRLDAAITAAMFDGQTADEAYRAMHSAKFDAEGNQIALSPVVAVILGIPYAPNAVDREDFDAAWKKAGRK